MKKIIFLLFVSCAHYPNVKPGTDIHSVELDAELGNLGLQEATRQANFYCLDKEKKNAKILSEKAVYAGEGKEEDYLMVKKRDGAIRDNQFQSGSNEISFDTPYKVTSTFKCED